MMNSRAFLVSGAGSGVGRAIARRIAEANPNDQVFLLGRGRAALEATRQDLPRPDRHRLIVADLRDRPGLARALAEAELAQANLVGVIANAGVGGANQYGPDDRWDEVIDTNLGGTYRLVQECLPALRASKEPYRHIVITASVLARLGVPGYAAYCASKAGLLGLMRSWASEYARERILVNAICPGWVDTEMARSGIEGIAHALGKSIEETRAGEMSRVPLGKMSQPREVAELVQFLVGGAQLSITGQTLDINGGAVMP